MRISKYQPWTDYLINSSDDLCRMTFEEIEKLIGDKLPNSAKTYASVFWNNSNGHYAKHWLKSGRIVIAYDSVLEYAVFKKDGTSIDYLSKEKHHVDQQGVNKNSTVGKLKHPAISCGELIAASRKYMQEITTDQHARYLSWEHCHNYFIHNYVDPNDEQIDLMCLHLAWYLASWGMLRGGSFLLQKDYRIHWQIVKLLVSKEYHELYDCPIEKLSDPMVCAKIIELSEKMVELYKGLTIDLGDGEGRNASDTLITKILLGTIGCTPAYDRYFKCGLALSDVAQQRYGQKSMMQLVRYYLDNYAEFESFREEISRDRVAYTPMKILDMCFWQIGFDHDLSSK